jgi:large subunit ribosomal protein L6
MIEGVTDGFKKTLEIVGVGYRAENKPFGLTLALGYSHPIDYPAPEGIELKAVTPTVVEVTGANKEVVGRSRPRSGRCVRRSPTRARA